MVDLGQGSAEHFNFLFVYKLNMFFWLLNQIL